MSKVAEFYAKVMGSEELQEKLREILKGKNVLDATEEELKKIGELAKGIGFDIALEEAKEYLRSDELAVSDEALDAVAGGNQKGDLVCKGEDAGNQDKTSPKIKPPMPKIPKVGK